MRTAIRSMLASLGLVTLAFMALAVSQGAAGAQQSSTNPANMTCSSTLRSGLVEIDLDDNGFDGRVILRRNTATGSKFSKISDGPARDFGLNSQNDFGWFVRYRQAGVVADVPCPIVAVSPVSKCTTSNVPGGVLLEFDVEPAPARVQLREYTLFPVSRWRQSIDGSRQSEEIFVDDYEPGSDGLFLRYVIGGQIFETQCLDFVSAPQFDQDTPLICTETLLADGSAQIDFFDFATLGLGDELDSTRFTLRTSNPVNARNTSWVATFNGPPKGSFNDDSFFGLNLDGKRDAFIRYRSGGILFDVACRFDG